MNSGRYFKRLLCTFLAAILISIGSIAWWTSPAQADTFSCYQRSDSKDCSKPIPVLIKSCGSDADFKCCEEVKKDFHINDDDRKSNITVLAIHGGLIEPHSDEVSQKLADLNNWNFYNFLGHGDEQCLKGLEGSIRERNFKRLHITSTRFNHEKALKLVRDHPKSVSIHG